MQTKKTGIVILDYNNADDTIKCIDSVLKYSNHNTIQIAIVDNGSNENNIASVKRYLEKLQLAISFFDNPTDIPQESQFINYILSKENKGYAVGNNIGIDFFSKNQDIDYIMILNNDILFTESITEKLTSILSTDSTIAIASPILYKIDGSIDYNCARKEITLFDLILQESFILRKLPFFSNRINKQKILNSKSIEDLDEIIDIELPSGACFIIQKDLFLSVSKFDPNTFLYYEENILYHKLLRKKMRSVLVTSCSCIHLGGNSTKKEKSLFLVRCSQNSMMYYLKYYRKSSKFFLYYLKSHFLIKNMLIYLKSFIK